MQLRTLRSPPAAFAGDQLEPPLPDRTHDDRLDDPARSDRFGQFGQRRFVKVAAGLIGIGIDERNRQLGKAGGCRNRSRSLRRTAAHQRLLAPRFAKQGT